MTEPYSDADQAYEDLEDKAAGIDPADYEDDTYYENDEQAYDDLLERSEQREAVRESVGELTEEANKMAELADGVWTNEEVQYINQLQGEEQRLRADHEKLVNDYNNSNLKELEKTDPERAQQVKTDLVERQRDLEQRAAQLQEAGSNLQKTATQKLAKTEMNKLVRAAPELNDADNRQELRQWLLDKGFSQQDVDSTMDHRLIAMAHRAMKAEKMESKKPRTRVRAVNSGKSNNKQQNSEISKLEKNLRSKGTVDAAYEFLQAKKRARA